MNHNRITLRIFTLFCVLALAGLISLQAKDQTQAKGHLVIVGGALSSKENSIFEALTQRLNPESKVAIIPAASSKPSHYGNSFKQQLISFGLKPDQISVLPLATKDDSSTDAIDESTWAANANLPSVVSSIESADLIWFTGGDQSRIIEVLHPTNEGPTDALIALKKRLYAGATVGGTSAGAAIMSQTMLVGGSSSGALFSGTQSKSSEINQEDGGLLLGTGLGFFPYGVIDQHFDVKARLGRLMLATLTPDADEAYAFGIDENTALVVDLASHTGAVYGAGRVTLIDTSNASLTTEANFSPPFRIKNIALSSLGEGDQIDFNTLQITPSSDKMATHPAPYYQISNAGSSGILSSYPTLNQLLAMQLVDNKSASTAISYLINESMPYSYRLELTKNADSEGYWTYRNGQEDHYTVIGIQLSIEPVHIQVEPLISF